METLPNSIKILKDDYYYYYYVVIIFVLKVPHWHPRISGEILSTSGYKELPTNVKRLALLKSLVTLYRECTATYLAKFSCFDDRIKLF